MLENLGNKTNQDDCKRTWPKTDRLKNEILSNVQNELQTIKKTLETQTNLLQALSKKVSDLS